MKSLLDTYRRVNLSQPCPICGKNDWCLVSSDGASAVCGRVESDKPFGEAGYFHVPVPGQVYEVPPPSRKKYRAERDEIISLAVEWHGMTRDVSYLGKASMASKATKPVVKQYMIGWRGDCATIPMWDNDGICGIRFRSLSGRKWSLSGSKNGLFRALDERPRNSENILVVVEGASDTFAAARLGYTAIGVPSAGCGLGLLSDWVKSHSYDRIVVVSDNDEVGIRHSHKVRDHLLIAAKGHRIPVLVPDFSDDLHDNVTVFGSTYFDRAVHGQPTDHWAIQ